LLVVTWRRNFFVSRRIVFTDCGKSLVFVAEKQKFTPSPARFALHPGNAVEYGSLKILL